MKFNINISYLSGRHKSHLMVSRQPVIQLDGSGMANLQFFISQNFELLAKVVSTFATRLKTPNLIVSSLTQHVSHLSVFESLKWSIIDFRPSTSRVKNIGFKFLMITFDKYTLKFSA